MILRLARHVEDVRVTEHQVIQGKPVTTIAGEIDTAGMLRSFAKLGALAEDASFDFDLSKLGLEIGDTHAVLTIDERTQLIDSARVSFAMSAEGKSIKLDLRYGSRARTSRSSCLLRAARKLAAQDEHRQEPTLVAQTSEGAASRPGLATTLAPMDVDREWWLRVPAVLLSPRSVFAALRNEEQEDVEARSEPVLALTLLAGVAVVLGTSTARVLYDDPLYDPLTLAIWIVLAGGFVAFAGYFIVGGALYVGSRGLGSLGTFRRARHVLGFAVAPLALSALVLWPLGLALFGTDLFKNGGDDAGVAGDLFYAAALGFSLWALALLLVGVRTVHGWSWWRSLAALGLVALFLAAFSIVF